MKAFFQALISNIIFAGKIGVGFYATIWLVRLLESATWQNVTAQASLRLPFVSNLKTAVIVVGGLFIVTWSLHLFDKVFYKGRLKKQYGLKPQTGLNFGDLFTSHLVHVNDDHLYGNTRHLLLFAAIAVLIVPDFQAFFLVTAVMMIIQGAGVWLFGQKGTVVMGASGMVLAFYSFDVVYGLAYPSWRNIIAILLLIFRGRLVWLNLRHLAENTSVAGHLWGFLSGILAALWLIKLGVT
jgi:membrane associated rhomboid family serine protease